MSNIEKLSAIIAWINSGACPEKFNPETMRGIYRNYQKYRSLTVKQADAINRVYVAYRLVERK
jgi:hypothetical protein